VIAGGGHIVAQAPGSFTDAQATRGAALYQGRCAECHGEEAQGDGNGITPPLAGLEFRSNWGGLPLSNLLDRIRQESQQSSGPSFTRPQQADILAFLLSRNGIAAGETELPADPAALSTVLLSSLVSR
jgi:mono/diheme cytochrome c family protein